MKIENLTGFYTADLEALILGALKEFGIERHGRDRVVIKHSDLGSHGRAYLGKIVRWNGRARMKLWIVRPRGNPDAEDVRALVWLIRHEVAHWAGIDHSQMANSLHYWRARPSRTGPFGCELPLPEWAVGMTLRWVGEQANGPAPKERPSMDAKREDKLLHARMMLANARRKAKLAATIEKRWKRRLAAAERAVRAAAGRTR